MGNLLLAISAGLVFVQYCLSAKPSLLRHIHHSSFPAKVLFFLLPDLRLSLAECKNQANFAQVLTFKSMFTGCDYFRS